MKDTMREIKYILQNTSLENRCEEELLTEAEKKLTTICQTALCDCEDNNIKVRINAINAFLSSNEINKHKLLSFCLNFSDPTVRPRNIIQNGEQIQQHRILYEDELESLEKFIKRHECDCSFSETVWRIMDKRGMTPPQVYKAVFLPRQDFSRAMDFKAKNIKKQIVWQIIIGLHCNLEEADEVLFSAGHVRKQNKFDLIMQFFIESKNYDIIAIDEILYEWGLKTFIPDIDLEDEKN